MDPARFWEITPRLLTLEFKGAALKQRRERELVWIGAMLPHLKKPPTLEQFLGKPVDDAERVARFHATWDLIDRALRR